MGLEPEGWSLRERLWPHSIRRLVTGLARAALFFYTGRLSGSRREGGGNGWEIPFISVGDKVRDDAVNILSPFDRPVVTSFVLAPKQDKDAGRETYR